MTARAVAALVLGALLILAARAFGTDSLYVPGLGLIALVATATAWVGLASAGAHAQRAPSPQTVEEQQPLPIRVRFSRGMVAPALGELIDPLLGRAVPLGGRAPDRVRIDVRFERRGRRTMEPGTLRIGDPLGIASRALPVDGDRGELLVLPRIEPLVVSGRGGGVGGTGSGLDDGGRALMRGGAAGAAAELDLDGLRPYRPGTPASRIHWPAMARSGDMLERRLSADADSAPLVVLDASSPSSEADLDAAVRAAASICVDLARRGGCACLVPGDRRSVSVGTDLQAWPSLHARLALVAATAARPSLPGGRRAGAVIWVTARSEPPRDLARVTAASAWLVSPRPDQPDAAAFTVAGCAAVQVGTASRRRAA